MDYTKIPDELREDVRNWIRGNKISELLDLHDRYKLSEYKYGCCNYEGMMTWYRHGLNTGQI